MAWQRWLVEAVQCLVWGWILYESGQVMSHDIHDILQKCPNHIPLLHSRWDHLMDRTLLLSEMRVELLERRGQLVGETYVTVWWPCSQQVLIWKSGKSGLQTQNMGERGEEVCRGKSYVCWKWNWAEYLTFLTLLPPVSVQVGFSLARPSPGSPLVSGVDNPVGDRGHTVDSHRYFAFNWRLTSTYIPDQVLFSFGRWVWLMRWVSPAHTFSHTPAPHQLTWCTLIVSISRLPTRSSLISRPLALSSQLNNLKRINCDHLLWEALSVHFIL